MIIRTLTVIVLFFFCNIIALAESNKLPVDCLKAILIILDDVGHKEIKNGHQPDLRLYVEKSMHQSICGINENNPNKVYLLFQLKYINEEGRELVARPSYLVDIEENKILEFKGRG